MQQVPFSQKKTRPTFSCRNSFCETNEKSPSSLSRTLAVCHIGRRIIEIALSVSEHKGIGQSEHFLHSYYIYLVRTLLRTANTIIYGPFLVLQDTHCTRKKKVREDKFVNQFLILPNSRNFSFRRARCRY